MQQKPSPIRVLDKETAELIAAGEVVERPASIVKELLENSVDSGADTITLEIRSGGVTFIRVSDNGCGIHRADVPTAFLRHATSKISQKADLQSILTYGFRGEALAAVAAVAKVEILTRAEDELSGTLYRIEGGSPICCEDAGCPQGTSITVRDLFYNTPARMKFLKRDSVETSAVSAVIERAAISNPKIAMKFIVNGTVRLHTPGDGKPLSAIHMVFGKDFSGALLPVENRNGGVLVNGYIIRPEAARSNRSMQYFFVNGRYIRSKICSAALDEGYKGSVMAGRFAACVLNVEIDPSQVDVNVHPAKIEVKFSDEKAVYDAVYFAVRSVFHKNDLSPQLQMKGMDFRKQVSFDYHSFAPANSTGYEAKENPLRMSAQEYHVTVQGKSLPEPSSGASPNLPPKPKQPSIVPAYSANKPFLLQDRPPEFLHRDKVSPLLKKDEDNLPSPSSLPEKEKLQENDPFPEKGRFKDARIVGELFETYLVLEQGDRVLLVDKHAAHERLLYERFKADIDQSNRQILLEPVTVNLSSEEFGVLVQNQDTLYGTGFSIEEFGFNTILVREAPMSADGFDLAELVTDLAQQLLRNRKQLLPEKIDDLLHNIACRCAIKAHNQTSKEEFEEILRLLSKHEDVKFCPHGRPIAIELTKREIEKQFGRIV